MENFGTKMSLDALVGQVGGLDKGTILRVHAPISDRYEISNSGEAEPVCDRFTVEVAKLFPVKGTAYCRHHVRVLKGGVPGNKVAHPVGVPGKGEQLYELCGWVIVQWMLSAKEITSRAAMSRLDIVRYALRELRTWTVPVDDSRSTTYFMREPGQAEEEGPNRRETFEAVRGEDPVRFRSFARPNDRSGTVYMTGDTMGRMSFACETMFELVHSAHPYGDTEIPKRILGHVFERSNTGQTFLRWIPMEAAIDKFLFAIRHRNFSVDGWRGFREIVDKLHDLPSSSASPFLELGEFLLENDDELLHARWGDKFCCLYGLTLTPGTV